MKGQMKMEIRQDLQWHGFRPMTMLKAWTVVTGQLLGLPQPYSARALQEQCGGRISFQAVRYAIQGYQCGPAVAAVLGEATGIPTEFLTSCEKRAAWTVPLLPWVRQGALDKGGAWHEAMSPGLGAGHE